jgi:hypothetical protein
VTAVGALLALAGCGGGGGGSAHGGSGGAGLTGLGGSGGFGLTGGGGSGLVDGGFGLTDGGGSTGTDGPPLTPAPPLCGNGIVETGETCDVAAGCAPGQPCNATCSACGPGPAASMDSGELIAAALAAGRIDYVTSLLYRAFRLAGDGRLPPELLGDLTVAEDPSLFLEISRQWATLTAAQQSELAPYIVRPTDPTSVYSTAPTAAMFDDTGDQLFAAGDADPIQCPVIAGTSTSDWRWSEANHFVVWSCGSGDLSTDPYAAKRAAAAAIADQVWALETPSMGMPRPDDLAIGPGDQTRTDIFLLPLNKCIHRGPNTLCAALTSPTLIAGTVPDSPCDASRGPLTSSGFILLRLDLTPDAAPAAGAATKARSDFAHEFFHLLTYAYNMEVQGGACRNTKYTGAGGKGTWLTEASAVWAEWAYTPADDPDYRGNQFTDYQGRIPASDSLLDVHVGAADNPAYQAFVYPLFLSQEAAARAPFEAFWKTASAARTGEALDDLLDTRFPFDAHFRDFAVRMLNLTLSPGNPEAPLLMASDEAVPIDYPPSNMAPEMMLEPLDTDINFHVTLAPLAARCQNFTVDDNTRFIDLDLTGTGADVTLDAFVKVKGTWERRRPNGPRLTFCRDDARDDVSEMYVIIANTGHAPSAKVDADYKLKTRTACPDSFTGWIRSERLATKHIQIDGDTSDDYERMSETWTLGDETTFNDFGLMLPAVDVYWSGRYERHDAEVTTVTGACQRQPVLQTFDAAGSGSHLSQLAFSEGGNGTLIFSATGAPAGSFNAPVTAFDETCDGLTQSSTTDNIVDEDLAAVSVYLMLTPDPNDPSHYAGMTTVAHQETPETGGSDLVDWVVTWDVTRTRK